MFLDIDVLKLHIRDWFNSHLTIHVNCSVTDKTEIGRRKSDRQGPPVQLFFSSFRDDVLLTRITPWATLKHGIYISRLTTTGTVAIELLEQSLIDGSVKFEIYGCDELGDRYGYMNYSMFVKMFVPIPDDAYILNKT